MPACQSSHILQLPIELRHKVYEHIFIGQLIHCCRTSVSRSNKHLVGLPTILDPAAQRHAFDQECLTCSGNDLFDVSRTSRQRWHNASCSVETSLRPRDLLNFFLTCRTFWSEAEPVFWKIACFSIGFPQLASFHERFLQDRRPDHPIPHPRGQLLRKLRILMPDKRILLAGLDSDFHYGPTAGSRGRAIQAIRDSTRILQSSCDTLPSLDCVQVIVSPTRLLTSALLSSLVLTHDLDPPVDYVVFAPLLALEDCLRSFNVEYVDLADLPNPPIHLQTLSPQHATRRKLEAVRGALQNMLTAPNPGIRMLAKVSSSDRVGLSPTEGRLEELRLRTEQIFARTGAPAPTQV